jgi:hypothetical protein
MASLLLMIGCQDDTPKEAQNAPDEITDEPVNDVLTDPTSTQTNPPDPTGGAGAGAPSAPQSPDDAEPADVDRTTPPLSEPGEIAGDDPPGSSENQPVSTEPADGDNADSPTAMNTGAAPNVSPPPDATSGGAGGAGGSPSGNAASGGTTSGGTANDGSANAPADGGSGASGPLSDPGDGIDVFGITQLYESAASGAAWTSAHWADGTAYTIDARRDEFDPSGMSGFRGNGGLQVTGDGELVMSGGEPRIYVYPEAEPWQNVEVTVYYQRVEDEGTGWGGLVIGARSGADGHTSDTPCDAHTYYSRLRHDGAADFEKELKHTPTTVRERVAPSSLWPPDGELPRGTWIGWKYVIYNLPAGGAVKLEAYRDLEGGAGGGNWQLINETTDDGGWFTDTDCVEHTPENGQSDLVVLDGGVTFIRNTNVSEARYRWLTIREIAPPE